MTPQMGVVTPDDVDAAVAVEAAARAAADVAEVAARLAAAAAHVADLDAHTKNLYETLRTGVYLPPIPYDQLLQVAYAANYVQLTPFLVARLMTIDAIAIQVTTFEAASHIRLGIYEAGVNFAGGALVRDYGAVDTSTNGVKAAAGVQQLAKGWYYLAVLPETNLISLQALYRVYLPLGLDVANFAAEYSRPYFAQAYGALPAACGALAFASLPYLVAYKISSLD